MSQTAAPPAREALGVSSIFSASFSFVFQNLVAIAVLVGLPTIALFALMAITAGGLFWSAGVGSDGVDDILSFASAFYVVIGLLVAVAYMVVYAIMLASLTQATFDHHYGDGVKIGVAFRTGLRRALPVTACFLVVSLIYIAVIGVFVLLTRVTGLDVVGIILAMICVIGLAPFLASAIPCCTIEANGLKSIGRSIHLAQGYFWPIFGLFALFFLAMMGISIVSGIFQVMFMFAPSIAIVVTFIVQVTVSVLTGSLAGAMIALIYGRLREIKEGSLGQSDAEVFS